MALIRRVNCLRCGNVMRPGLQERRFCSRSCYEKWRYKTDRAVFLRDEPKPRTLRRTHCPCGTPLIPGETVTKSNAKQGHGALCHQCYCRQRRERIKRQREDLIEQYGGKCACCGEGTHEFLSIDHINGGGLAQRRKLGTMGLYHWLRRRKFPKDSFRLLCMNCNWSLGRWGHCPHGMLAEHASWRRPSPL